MLPCAKLVRHVVVRAYVRRTMAVCLVFAAHGPRQRSYFLARLERAPVSAECIHRCRACASSIRAGKYERSRVPGAAKTKQTAIARKPQTSTHSDPELVPRCGFAHVLQTAQQLPDTRIPCLLLLDDLVGCSLCLSHQTTSNFESPGPTHGPQTSNFEPRCPQQWIP